MDPMQEFVQQSRVVLERRRVASVIPLARPIVFDMQEGAAAFVMDQLLGRLETEVFAQRLVGDTKTGEAVTWFPASPFQFWKQRHAGAWWLRWLVRRRPVREVAHRTPWSVTFERYAHYPAATIETPKLGRPVIWEAFQ
jgi:hypothetical protein